MQDQNNMLTIATEPCEKPHCYQCNPPVVTAEQFIALAQRLRDAAYPTTGRDAFLLWEWSNREDVHGELAISEMRKLGYKSLAGYPLQREKVHCDNSCVINSIIGGDHAYCKCSCHVGTLPAIPPSRERRQLDMACIATL